MSKIIESIPLPPVLYHGTEGSYWRRDYSNRWFKMNETSARIFIADYGYLKSPNMCGTNSEVDRCLLEIQSRKNVAYVGPLAGYEAGVYRMSGNQILVVDSPSFIRPQEGDWTTLNSLFEGMFSGSDIDQRPYFYGWIKNTMESFHERMWKASQLLAMAGPVGSGKSLTQNLLTAMFGGRSAKPYQFMMGKTTFNSHMFGAEHQILEDESESIDIRSRRNFAANIKTILTAHDQNCHGKNKAALILQPRWRLSLSLNDDPERLQVLPPLDSDIKDKIIILKVQQSQMPMNTGNARDDERFWNQLISEIPAFLHYLEQWEIPPLLTDDRYGIKAFQHPDIVEKLQQTAPELRLLELIDRQVFGHRFILEPWEGSAIDLQAKLRREGSEVSFEARQLLTWQNACGTYLGRLEESGAQHVQGRVTRRVVNGRTIWRIRPPADNRVADEEPTSDQAPQLPAGLINT